MEYNFRQIEKNWQKKWSADETYKVSNDSNRPKFYVLDMFPYPSGAGLHVGHPLGYISSDIYSRYKRLKGFNVLHPMGYDAFGLPAEQYAIEHGIHPAEATDVNIKTFRSQLDNIGFSFDWSRELRTSDPSYYKWTQWIFLRLFNSFFNRSSKKAEGIDTLVTAFEKEGNSSHPMPNAQYPIKTFSAGQWQQFDEVNQQDILMQYRLAYCGFGEVNWCEALGTVLANDEVINGFSERGNHPVVKKKLRQWYLRITEYADRLLEGLEKVDFSEAMKEMQTNWIGKSYGAEIDFKLKDQTELLRVYTTRPDTIFGVDFMVIAPEHELTDAITTPAQRAAVDEYIAYVKSRSERERMAEKKISGVDTGALAINPFSGKEIPVWISEYVLAGYGTGAIMAVPCGDERDFKFARHFNIPVTNIIGDHFNGAEANSTKDAKLTNSDFLNGTPMREASEIVIRHLEIAGSGTRKVNYKMRDAAFSRQRYWGEPFPIKWEKGIAIPLTDKELPLELPYVASYKAGPEGEGPLANIPAWTSLHLETNTMPGYAGSSWYFLRYMDPGNDQEFCSREASDYWNQVDIYIGGTEHAVGHLLYSRMWTKILFDLGHIGYDEPFRKLVNQGMITAVGYYAKILNFRTADGAVRHLFGNDADISSGSEFVVGKELSFVTDRYDQDSDFKRIPYAGKYLDVEHRMTRKAFATYKAEFGAKYRIENEKDFAWVKGDDGDDSDFFTMELVSEKMSKAKYNSINPDDLVEKYGADTFRMYEMFLGPVEQSKPWDTKGIEGVHRFLKKLWRLFFDENKGRIWNEDAATAAELKVLHRTIRKIDDDTERFSFNTAVSNFMICVNELSDLKSHKKEILSPLLVLLSPYAPHISEELWKAIGNEGSVLDASYPVFDAKHVTETSKEYPVSVNGKVRTNISISLSATQAEVEEIVLSADTVKKWLEGKPHKKIIYVKGKMINVVV
ncbi:MAG: leucine--tRNA ligase [Gemmatimonadaceae bacterium]|nr:leucine--tRNA ligase [Chitinophagaceae bacterium]